MSVSISLSPVPKIQFFDANGNPLVGGKLYTYAAGTTTPLATYTDSSGGTTNANPVILNSRGEASVWLGSSSYKFKLTTSTGVEIWTVDDITSNNYDVLAALAASGGSSLIGYAPSGTGAVTTTVQSKLRQTVSIFDFMTAAQIADVQAGTAAQDVTAAIQAAFDSIGAVTANLFQDISPKGVTIHFPAGRYLVTSTLYMPSNIRMLGTGMGTQFKFNPSVPSSDFLREKNNNVGGSALNRSNFSMHFENFYVFAARNGGSTTGRNGTPISTINTNTANCFNLTDVAYSSFRNVTVTDFWYGTAFNLNLDALFAYYNHMSGCFTRDCQLGVQTTSASHLTDCYFSHSTNFPPASIQPNVQYAVSFAGFRGCAMHGGSIECSCSVALIKNNGAGHTITGVYMEAFGVTPAMMDCSSLTNDSGNTLMGGNSYGFTNNILLEENISRGGNSFAVTLGMALGFGDCDELEIEHSSTRQSPSFKEGLPGYALFPAGGTISISTDSFIGNTSMALARGAGTAATDNQMSYNFVIKNSEKVLSNVWVTCLVKIEGGEDNFTIRTFDATNGNAFLKKQITFNNGWQLWGTYLRRVDNSTITFYVRQIAGSVDASRIVKVTALRAYTNGFKPIPSAYRFLEYRTAAPTTGTWKQGDIVWNSQPAAGGTPGWVCTTAGSPGTWKAMANLV